MVFLNVTSLVLILNEFLFFKILILPLYSDTSKYLTPAKDIPSIAIVCIPMSGDDIVVVYTPEPVIWDVTTDALLLPTLAKLLFREQMFANKTINQVLCKGLFL